MREFKICHMLHPAKEVLRVKLCGIPLQHSLNKQNMLLQLPERTDPAPTPIPVAVSGSKLAVTPVHMRIMNKRANFLSLIIL
jgi:hypothetical protein